VSASISKLNNFFAVVANDEQFVVPINNLKRR